MYFEGVRGKTVISAQDRKYFYAVFFLAGQWEMTNPLDKEFQSIRGADILCAVQGKY